MAAEQPTSPLPRIEQSAPVPPPDPHKIERSQSLKQELQQYLANTDLTQVLEQAAQVRIPTHVQQYALLGLVLLGIAGYIITVCCEAIDLLVRLGIEKCSDWLFILCSRIGKQLQPHWQAMQQALRRLWQQYGFHRTG
jgi:preprotein translocase subunit Sss1